ncbi:FAD-dependent oxidoreductase [Actinomadura hibisca]|uniref:FAD-dependent oxidoreductase n=1 Tax=Actinomadura hibisca TaxID=68565 RepID=UPI00082F23EB|nr:NAD(P)/FAD-dependent oxidoreductase [Actinomadura hibisca]
MVRKDGYDVIVVGGGPAGCAVALAFGRNGAEVLVLEAGPGPARAFAGEWLHPAGAAALARWGVELPEDAHARGTGFVIYPHDRSAPIELPYPGAGTALGFEHRVLVGAMRARLSAEPGVTLRTGSRVTAVRDDLVRYVDYATGQTIDARGRLIVGAEGRPSVVRRALELPDDDRRLGHAAGLLIDHVSLPFEGRGHVVLGGPGPILLYRVAPETVRVVLDVPRHRHGRSLDPLWPEYCDRLPADLRSPVLRALRDGDLRWASVGVRRRCSHGRGSMVLVGDAAGYVHPLTAVGLTLALTDAETLARTHDLEEYRRDRAARTRVPELLGVSLYEILSQRDPVSDAVSVSVYHLWRTSPTERERMMGFLGTENTSTPRFVATFTRCLLLAARRLAVAAASGQRGAPAAIGSGLRWMRWLVRGTALGRTCGTTPADPR